ncbi:hypothetical protein C7379_1191 [Hallella colorans]|uniref:Uncharacterized protein n=1 Tax=Hallella colorans TaxID=1703337 RepID=A0A2U0U1B2_9BACT|nr:hypothetical protein C7379_1191 [Hallella colorans]
MLTIASQALTEDTTAQLIFNGGAKGSVSFYFGGDTVGHYDCGNHV